MPGLFLYVVFLQIVSETKGTAYAVRNLSQPDVCVVDRR